ncbi:hypothetical protein [Gallaecimonas sp. GXIMD4217]|uniref:hypothetical protein n=1 Tax=Gallaecimonas sp. GXIMD4217 TaxID=3131927 RepID=UPI00311B1309
MKANTRKKTLYTIVIMLLAGGVFYASMEDYQKTRLAEFLGNLFSSNQQVE